MRFDRVDAIDGFFNDLDPEECQVLIGIVADIDPNDVAYDAITYSVEEMSVIGKFRDFVRRNPDYKEVS